MIKILQNTINLKIMNFSYFPQINRLVSSFGLLIINNDLNVQYTTATATVEIRGSV